MLPYYSVTSTHNDVLLFLEYYVSAACCFNKTYVITLRIINHYSLRTITNSFVTHMKAKYILWVSGMV